MCSVYRCGARLVVDLYRACVVSNAQGNRNRTPECAQIHARTLRLNPPGIVPRLHEAELQRHAVDRALKDIGPLV